jgi:hypothetical protein
MAAVKFDLVAEDRGVIEGSKVKKALLFIEESQDRNEQPQVQPEAAKIQACQILDFLPQGEEERYKDAPKYNDKNCAEGTREAVAGAPVVWTFDITKIAQEWGASPYDNNGVMFVPVLEAGKTWQVNLKVPRKDSPTEEGDQYEMSKNRTKLSLDFIPGEPPEIPEVPAVDDPAATTTSPPTSSGTSSVPSIGGTGTSPVISPSTDLTGAGDVTGAEAPTTAPTEQAGLLLPQNTGPRMPAYVWLAIPLGLLALSAVRSVILEPVGGPRPDGVIAAIRRRNAERRGTSSTERGGLLAGVTGSLRRGTGSIGKALSGATKTLRRKR